MILAGGHFDWSEVTGTALLPPAALLPNILRMATFMERVREIINEPLRITSWYRTPMHNIEIGGSPTSRHLLGLAVDFKPAHLSVALACDELLRKPRLAWDQLIEERTTSGSNWLHIGLAPDQKVPRQQVLRARGEVLGGVMHYEEVV